MYYNVYEYPRSLRLFRHCARVISPCAAAMSVQFLTIFVDFWRFLAVFGKFWSVIQAFTDFCTIWEVLGRFWASFGEPCWSHFGSQNGWKLEKCRILCHFLEHLRGMLIFRRFWDDFRGAWISKNEQKCGSVCSDSLFRVRNIRSISDASWARFWEGLGSILGGFSVPRAKKWRSRAV